MPIYPKERFPTFLKQLDQLPKEKVFFFFGEPFLCEMAAKKVINHLLGENKSNLKILYEEEIDSSLLEEKLVSLSLGKFYVIWVKRLHSISILNQKLLQNSINYLIITASDLKGTLPDFLQKKAVIFDFFIKPTDKQTQTFWIGQIIEDVLKNYHKKLTSKAKELLIQRIGFNLFAIKQQLELLINYVGEGDTIDEAAVEVLVAPSREEMIFELIGKISTGNVITALESLHHILEQDKQPLAILGILSNELRNLLEAKIFCEKFNILPQELSFQDFSKNVYPSLSKERLIYLTGFHPYIVYQIFKRATYFDIKALKKIHQTLTQADVLLKTTQTQPSYLLENIVFCWTGLVKGS